MLNTVRGSTAHSISPRGVRGAARRGAVHGRRCTVDGEHEREIPAGGARGRGPPGAPGPSRSLALTVRLGAAGAEPRDRAPRAAGGVADSGQPRGSWRRDIISIMVKTSTFGRVAIFWLVASNRSAVNVISRRCYALCAVLHPSRAGTNRLKAPLLTDASGCRTPDRQSGPGFGRLASSPLRAAASPPQHHPATTNSNTITACVDRIPCHFSDTHAQQLP